MTCQASILVFKYFSSAMSKCVLCHMWTWNAQTCLRMRAVWSRFASPIPEFLSAVDYNEIRESPWTDYPSGHTTLKQRRFNVKTLMQRWFDVDSTLCACWDAVLLDDLFSWRGSLSVSCRLQQLHIWALNKRSIEKIYFYPWKGLLHLIRLVVEKNICLVYD